MRVYEIILEINILLLDIGWVNKILKVPSSNSLDIESEENKKRSVINISGIKSLPANLKKL